MKQLIDCLVGQKVQVCLRGDMGTSFSGYLTAYDDHWVNIHRESPWGYSYIPIVAIGSIQEDK